MGAREDPKGGVRARLSGQGTLEPGDPGHAVWAVDVSSGWTPLGPQAPSPAGGVRWEDRGPGPPHASRAASPPLRLLGLPVTPNSRALTPGPPHASSHPSQQRPVPWGRGAWEPLYRSTQAPLPAVLSRGPRFCADRLCQVGQRP